MLSCGQGGHVSSWLRDGAEDSGLFPDEGVLVALSSPLPLGHEPAAAVSRDILVTVAPLLRVVGVTSARCPSSQRRPGFCLGT